jgi:hypothetical protein
MVDGWIYFPLSCKVLSRAVGPSCFTKVSSLAVGPVPVGVGSPSKATDLCTGVAASIRDLSFTV